MNKITRKRGRDREATTKACNWGRNKEGYTTRGIGVRKVSMEMTRVWNTGEENMVIILGSNGTKVTLTDEGFVGIIEMCFLDEQKVWA